MPFRTEAKVRLYIDCDGVIINTIEVARKMAIELGYDGNSYDGLHKFFMEKGNWQELIKKCEILANAVELIKALYATGKYKITILTKLSEEVLGKFTETLIPRPQDTSEEDKENSKKVKDKYVFLGEGTAPPKEEDLGDTPTEFYKLYYLRKLFPKDLFPDMDIIAIRFKANKEIVMYASNAILIEDSLGNFRVWRFPKKKKENGEEEESDIKVGIGILFSPGGRENYVYENKDDKPITDEEAKCVVTSIADLENVPEVQEYFSKKLIVNGRSKTKRKKINIYGTHRDFID